MRHVVIGFRKGITQMSADHMWIAGIFGDPDEAQSFMEVCVGRAIAFNKRRSALRAVAWRSHYSPEDPVPDEVEDDLQRVYDVALKMFKEVDRAAKIPELTDPHYPIEYVVLPGETLGFFREVDGEKRDVTAEVLSGNT